ncbi:MAG: hypothetical protein N3E42_05970 [Candidatus Bipolaricaulota bacterium]|nr:hypothetical protein [Candidatus Bipolaricaulota bacterium]
MEYDLDTTVQQIRLAYAEHLIRCTDLPPAEMEDFLSLDGDLDQARRWLALGYAKRRYDPDPVRGLLVYLFSNYYPPLVDDPTKGVLLRRAIARKSVKLSELTLEKIIGTKLEWTEVFQLVGKEFNPTRVKERIVEIYEELKGADYERSSQR